MLGIDNCCKKLEDKDMSMTKSNNQKKENESFFIRVPLCFRDKRRIESVVKRSGITLGKFTYSALMNETDKFEECMNEGKAYILRTSDIIITEEKR